MDDNKERAFRVPAVLLFVDFLITVLILYTDHNLQTDFGTTSPYFIHWYGLLITGIAALCGSIIIFARPGRKTRTAGATGTLILFLFLIGDVATYQMVGFTTPVQFATYLFGISAYPHSLPYIPGLYDILVIFYLISAIAGFRYRHKL